jgi:hypothetical protein
VGTGYFANLEATFGAYQCRDSAKDAKKYIEKYKRLEVAIDAFYNEPMQSRQTNAPSTSKLNQLFDTYKGEGFVGQDYVIVCGTPDIGLQTRMERISL